MATKEEKIALVNDLRSYDHCFISADGVRKFLEPFGIEGGVSIFKANPRDPKGLTLADGAEEAQGQDAATVAEMIAAKLGCNGSGMMGRGFRLRAACDAAIQKLQEMQ